MNRLKLIAVFTLLCGIRFVNAQTTDQTIKKGTEHVMMRQCFFVLLKMDPDRIQDAATVAQIQKGHLDNIVRLNNEGKLDLVGPYLDDTDGRGMFIFNVEPEKELKTLPDTDPAYNPGTRATSFIPRMAVKALF